MKYCILIIYLLNSSLHATIQIISSPSCKISILSEKEVKQLFLLKVRKVKDESITVVDSRNKILYAEFVKKHLRKSPKKMKAYWTRMLFTGRKIPPKKLSLKNLKNLEATSTCHIAYANINTKPKYWKIINIK